jgi:hypothetical protein
VPNLFFFFVFIFWMPITAGAVFLASFVHRIGCPIACLESVPYFPSKHHQKKPPMMVFSWLMRFPSGVFVFHFCKFFNTINILARPLATQVSSIRKFPAVNTGPFQGGVPVTTDDLSQ